MPQLSNLSFQKILVSIIFCILISSNLCNELSSTSEFIGKYPNFIKRLKNHEFKKIVFLVGAGISTSAGIPDFRSENGIFNQIKERYNLDSPEKFFDIDFFYKNPNLFYEFSKEFYSKNYEPTLFHYFMSFINYKNLLYYIFTQNIDNLESKLNIDKEKIVFSHGNLFEASCPKCGDKINFSNYLDYVMNNKVKYCEKCGSPVKSSVIFYGESLSEEFFEKSFDLLNADLIFIAGTNLEVAPFNKLAYGHTNQNSYRIVINKLRVGRKYVIRGLDYEDPNSKDIMLIGDCDEIVKMLIDDLGWKKEFDKYYEKMKKSG